MTLIESILYGIVSGLTEFLPVSSRAHQAIMRYLFGVNTRVPLQELLVHIGVLAAILVSSRDLLTRLRREQVSRASVRRRKTQKKDRAYFDLRLIKTASFPLFIGLFFCFATDRFESNLLILMSFWLINGLILLLADHTSRGNRDARTMSALDGVMIGLAGTLSALPGVSRTGMIAAYSTARGADDEHVVNWTVTLGIPAMLFAVLYDFISMFSLGIGVHSFGMFVFALLSGVSAFAGGYIGILLFKLALEHSGFSKFAYYSVGAGLFSFILYLIT